MLHLGLALAALAALFLLLAIVLVVLVQFLQAQSARQRQRKRVRQSTRTLRPVTHREIDAEIAGRRSLHVPSKVDLNITRSDNGTQNRSTLLNSSDKKANLRHVAELDDLIVKLLHHCMQRQNQQGAAGRQAGEPQHADADGCWRSLKTRLGIRLRSRLMRAADCFSNSLSCNCRARAQNQEKKPQIPPPNQITARSMRTGGGRR